MGENLFYFKDLASHKKEREYGEDNIRGEYYFDFMKKFKWILVSFHT